MSLANTHFIGALEEGTWSATRDGKPIGAADLTTNPNSVNVSLGRKIIEVFCLSPNPIDLHEEKSFGTLTDTIGAEGFVLQPGRLYLASVREAFDCSAPLWIPTKSRFQGKFGLVSDELNEVKTYFVQHIEGRSTVARVGLSTHASAGFGDYGFCAPFTLELTVALPLRVHEGDEIAQVAFVALSGKPDGGYQGAYAGQTGPRVAALGKERFQRRQG